MFILIKLHIFPLFLYVYTLNTLTIGFDAVWQGELSSLYLL